MSDDEFRDYMDKQLAPRFPAPPSVVADHDVTLNRLSLRLAGRSISGKHCEAHATVPMPVSWPQLCLMLAGERARFWGTV